MADGPERAQDDGEPQRIVLGLIAAPGPATELAVTLAAQLPQLLTQRLPGVEWHVAHVSDRLVEPPLEPGLLIESARERMLHEGWRFAVCITDLPLRSDRRPVVGYSSPTHGVAVLSLPALGAVDLRRRALRIVQRLAAALMTDFADREVSESDGAREKWSAAAREAVELGNHTGHDQTGIGYVAGVIGGNFRLILGMLRANRPWRAVIQLSSAVVGALGIAVLSLVNGFIWQIADSGGVARLSALTVASTSALALTLIVAGRLFEQVPRPTGRARLSGVREQVVLFNVVTVTTVVIGVMVLYGVLLVATAAVSILLLPPDQISHTIGHPAGIGTFLSIAWLSASLATVGGALGAGLQTSSTIREVAYTYRPENERPR